MQNIEQPNGSSIQCWLIKISFSMALSTFFLIVIPHEILFLARNTHCPGSLVFMLRRYTQLFQATNSILGLTISIFISPELRSAMKSTFSDACRFFRYSISRHFISDRAETKSKNYFKYMIPSRDEETKM